jgi:hypothetical protein
MSEFHKSKDQDLHPHFPRDRILSPIPQSANFEYHSREEETSKTIGQPYQSTATAIKRTTKLAADSYPPESPLARHLAIAPGNQLRPKLVDPVRELARYADN